MTSVLRSRGTSRAAVSTVVSAVLAAGALTGTGAALADPAPAPATLSGRTVFLDPGHQGSSAGHALNQQVPDGRGGTKDCQTSGATSLFGEKKKEHTITWEVTQLVKAALEREGARVVLSRNDDTGWGGCVDERAAAAGAARADLAVSVHADSTSGKPDNGKSGFHLIVPKLPIPDAQVNSVQSGEGRKASTTMRDAMVQAGFKPSNYTGSNGLQTRSDIAGANLTKVPLVFLEMGNLSNEKEANALSSASGEAKYAVAITNGIKSYLAGAPAAAAPGAEAPAPGAGLTDLASLKAVEPLFDQLASAKSPEEAAGLLASLGPDVSAEVLKAMLSVVYTVFGGKLPI
ncbi:N-acetylmuramoyl-L-alanine amidase [Gordonia sp. VNK21]|uniref:N-acetylmuramoyl-L-alanine amidase n=1 Tax=Gordonia sp. VNK21 TaxID=3382483 RepID=UPI0038D4ADD9